MLSIYLYAISNPAFPGWLKIGRSNNPKRRCEGYQTSDPLRRYRLVYYVKVDDICKYENIFYEGIKGEWLYITLGEFVEKINAIKAGKIKEKYKYPFNEINVGEKMFIAGHHFIDVRGGVISYCKRFNLDWKFRTYYHDNGCFLERLK